jgi:hypothetical protein
MSFQPGIVQLVIFMNTASSAIQNWVFRNRGFRDRMGMAPLPEPVANSKPIWTQLKEGMETTVDKEVAKRKARVEAAAKAAAARKDLRFKNQIALAKDYERRMEQEKKRNKITRGR